MTALRAFVADLMEREGAAVEPLEPDGLAVMAPPDVRAALGWPELARLGFGDLPAGAVRVGVEDGWLDRFATLIGDRGRWAERQIDCDAPPILGDAQRLLDRILDLPNAVWRFRGQRSTWTRCLVLAFRMTAVSDEKRESNLWIGFNGGTGASFDRAFVDRLRTSFRDHAWRASTPEARGAAGAGWDVARLEARVRPALDASAHAELAPFLRSMQRRLERDHARLHGYHDDLRRESLTRLTALEGARGPKAEADRLRERQRIAAVEREYLGKLGDLEHKYALRGSLEWVQTLELLVPVQRLEVLIRRRKGERAIEIDWHPLVRLAEPPLCEWGRGLGSTRLVCDDGLHLTEPAGQDPCLGCAKPFCRACHPRECPRCGRAVNGGAAVAADGQT